MKVLRFRTRLLIASAFLVCLLLLALYNFVSECNCMQMEKQYGEPIYSYLPGLSGNKDKAEFKYLTNEETICGDIISTQVTLLVGVFSRINEKPLRDFVRTRWGAVARENPKMRLIFILGRPERTSNDMTFILEESKKNRDIIQANFTDTYSGLIYKSFAFFKWAYLYCRGAKYLFKVDSDMQIDLMRFLAELEKDYLPDQFLCGVLIEDVFPERNKSSKWYVSTDIFPDGKYPTYCQGAAYLVSQRIAEKIADVQIPSKIFPVDDVYMTGILRELLKEGIAKQVLHFHHHYDETETKVTEGNFSKFIMTIEIRHEDAKIKLDRN